MSRVGRPHIAWLVGLSSGVLPRTSLARAVKAYLSDREFHRPKECAYAKEAARTPGASGDGHGRGSLRSALLQTTVPAYRDRFVQRLLEESPSFDVWAGDEYFDPSIRLSPRAARVCRHLTNRFFLGRWIEWQQGAFSAARTARTVVLEMNPRILSNWPILIHRRMLGRRSVLWGHAWGRTGGNSKTFLARKTMMRLANAILVYTEREQAQLAPRISTPVFVAPNAVVSVDQWSSGYDGNPLNAVIVGRLVPAKKPALAMEAWLRVCGTLDSSARLVYVGDGPARKALEAKAARHKYVDRVRFMGEVTDRQTLNSVYADAFVTISPGYAGLSLTDSLGYGVPMLIADRERHAPEIALATEANSRFFTAGSAASLGQGILQFYRDRASWFSQRADIAAPVRRAYSIEAMVDGFLAAAEPH